MNNIISTRVSKKLPLIAVAAAALLLSFPATSFAQVATTTASSTVTVTIHKMLDGQPATALSANSTEFPLSAAWNAANLGAGSGQFSLSPSGFGGDPTPYQAITADMSLGASYSVGELTNGTQVGANCAAGKPFALVGYTTGDTYPSAATGTPTSTVPTFGNLTNDKHVLVWNTKCTAPAATTTTTGNLNVITTVSGGSATPSDFQIHVRSSSGTDILGSPQAGSLSGTMHSGLATGTYMVSATSGPANYQTTSSGDCDVAGNVVVMASTTKTCTLTNTFIGTTTPTTTPATGSLQVMHAIVGGTSTQSNFQIHVKRGGTDIGGSPFAALSTGFILSGLPTGLYVLSAAKPTNYQTIFTEDCDVAGNITVATSTTKSCTLTDTFVGTTTPTTTPPIVSSTTPQAQKQSVLNALLELRTSMLRDPSWNNDDHHDRFHPSHRGLLESAIANLRVSLSRQFWVDGSHLDDETGDPVFDHEQDAVLDLMQLMGDEGNTADDATLQNLIDQLMAADRILAETAIADAVAANGTPHNITKANSALTKGDTARANGRTLRAMWRYQQAWGFAVTSH